jgi:hypothetical protein
MEMKPFDLERARAGDPITLCNGIPAHFIGTSTDGHAVVEVHGLVRTLFAEDLLMASKITTFYVNIYKAHYGLWCGTPETTIEEAERARKDAHGTESPNFYKVVSFEVEE